MATFKFICLALALSSAPALSQVKDPFTIDYQWNLMDYLYDSTEARKADIDSGNFNPMTSAPVDVDVWSNGNGEKTVFVTTPRLQKGVPASLSTVVLDENKKAVLKPYPSWDWFKNEKECKSNRIITAFGVYIDECNKLWVMDSGRLNNVIVCPPQILAFDLKTNKLVHQYEIPKEQYTVRSGFTNLVVENLDKEDNCNASFVYAADTTEPGLLVFDVEGQKSWRAVDASMLPEKEFSKYNIAGDTFDEMYGILGLTLSTKHECNKCRKLFYHAMSSNKETWVHTRDLRNKTLFVQGNDASNIFNVLDGTRDTQSAAEACDKEGVLFYGLLGDVKIGCYETHGKFGADSDDVDIVGDNKETLQFPSGMKIKHNQNDGEQLYMLTSRFQKILANTLDAKEVNFRIQHAPVNKLKEGTKCLQKNN